MDKKNSRHSNKINTLPTRDQVPKKYKWNLKDIYKSDSAWEEDFKSVEADLKNYKKYKGSLAKSSSQLLKCLKFDDGIGIKLERLHLYAMLAKDADMRSEKYQSMEERVNYLYSAVAAASSFIRPEIIKIPSAKLKKMIARNKSLKLYSHLLNELMRKKSHTLSTEEEKILALSGEISSVPYSTYSMFTNADIKFPVVKDDSGNKVEISHARFYSAMYSSNRKYRERAFKNYLAPYKAFANTLTVLLNGNLKVNIFNARARNYSSAREASLDVNNIPLTVYDNLLDSVSNNLEPLHRWAKVKKRILKANKIHPYDVYVSLFKQNGKKYLYNDALKIVREALKPLGNDYQKALITAFNNRWIDVYETKAKRSGAYSSGTTYGVHPYVLLNWSNLLNDVFTLAHEMGHNMHSYFTGNNQPYPYSHYTIFVAEVASTFNEALLLEYLIKNSQSKNEKLHLIEKYLENITATFYRQTMFAEFEKVIYEKTESGSSLTAADYCKLYKDIYSKYWGPDMEVDEEETYTWARIPHFYYNFYVYQYATGFAASQVLANKILSEGSSAVKKYLNFLKSGSSDYSINLLKNAGVNMESTEPIQATTNKMNELLDELESLL